MLKLYVDHHVHAAVTEGLRRRGVDVLTPWQDGTADWDDELLLDRATRLERLLFSQDQDLLAIAARWRQAQKSFYGILYAHQTAITIGRAIDEIEFVCQAATVEEMRDAVLFLPLR